MAEGLDDVDRLIRDSAIRFVDEHQPLARIRPLRSAEHGFDRAVWRSLGELGWLGLLVPEAMGGTGLGLAQASLLCNVFGGALLPEPFIACALIPSVLLSSCAPGSGRDRLMAGLIDGSALHTLAWQERTGQSELADTATRLTSTAGGWRLDGRKQFVPAGDSADHLLITAEREGRIALVSVARGAVGVSVTAQRLPDGSRVAELSFEGVTVSRDDLLSADAEEAVVACLDHARIAIASALLGVASRALEITRVYMGQRVQFGRTIASFQALQHRFVDLATRCALSDATIAAAVATYAQAGGPGGRVAAAVAKASASETAIAVTKGAIQLHGGMGYTDEADIGLYLKSAMRHAAWLGTARAQRARFVTLAEQARSNSAGQGA